MKRTLIVLAVFGLCGVAEAGPGSLRRRGGPQLHPGVLSPVHDPHPMVFERHPPGPWDGLPPSLPPVYEGPVLHESDPSKPSVWGVIEAVGMDGWYGVHIKTEKCAAPSGWAENANHVVAYAVTGGDIDVTKTITESVVSRYTVGVAVFMRHDHKTGRWHILFPAGSWQQNFNYQGLGPLPQSPSPPDAEPAPTKGTKA